MGNPGPRSIVYSKHLKPNLVLLICAAKLPVRLQTLRKMYVSLYEVPETIAQGQPFKRRFRNAVLSLEENGLQTRFMKFEGCPAHQKVIVNFQLEEKFILEIIKDEWTKPKN